MKYDKANPQKPPAPEQLAAYVDGELDPRAHSAIEAWLARHPESAAEVAGLQRLARAMQATSAPEPGPQAWHNTKSRIAADLAAPRLPVFHRRRLFFGFAAAVAAVALVLNHGPFRPMVAEQPYPVAESQDVVILSMDPGDAQALVIGNPLAVDAMVLAGPGEVSLVSVEPYHSDGIMPNMWGSEGSPPMIVPPAGSDDPKK